MSGEPQGQGVRNMSSQQLEVISRAGKLAANAANHFSQGGETGSSSPHQLFNCSCLFANCGRLYQSQL